MSVEANAATNDAPLNDTAADTSGSDAELDAVWDKFQGDNSGSATNRGADGRFAPKADANTGDDLQADEADKEPLEGGGGEDGLEGETSTPPASTPLPSTMLGLEDVWSKLPDDARKSIAENQNRLHKTLSNQGRELAAYKPIGDAINAHKDYFGGERGNFNPAEAIEYMFNVQRSMDDNPLQTWLDVAKGYNLFPHLAKIFGGQGEDGQPHNNGSAELLAQIGELKQTISDLTSRTRPELIPELVDKHVEQKLIYERELDDSRAALSRTSKDMPLRDEIQEEDMVAFIGRSWRKLGETASKDAVIKLAYDMAVNADPDLRKKAAALNAAAVQDPRQIADVKRANATNLRSTSTGRPRERTEDEELDGIWDKYQRA